MVRKQEGVENAEEWRVLLREEFVLPNSAKIKKEIALGKRG